MARSASYIKDILLNNRRLTEDQWAEASLQAEDEARPVEAVLVEMALVSQNVLTLAAAEAANMAPIRLSHFSPDHEMLVNLPAPTLLRHKMMPIAMCGKSLTVAMADPFNIMAVDELAGLTGLKIVSVVASQAEITTLLEQLIQNEGGQLQEILNDVEDVELDIESMDDLNLEEMLEIAEDAPVIRVVNSILVEGLQKGCSDIHVEPMEKTMRLRYRIDGILYETPSPPISMLAAISSRIKIMSNMDIAERRVPQDGRFKIKALDKAVDIRVSVLPTVHGEKIVMRILDKASLPPGVGSLGLDDHSCEKFMEALRQPYGMLFVTGPTGSGKTTTLYSALQELNKEGVNIITIEDPVEYQLKGVNQVQTNNQVGLSFASGLRAILRQDPDIVLVGEVRDTETASICVQAALTGHLVLSTLHTNDASGAIDRLMNMGIEPFMIASSLILAQAQRLYRKLCPACKEPTDAPEEFLRTNGVDPSQYNFSGATFFKAVGCWKCSDIGYRNRGAIMEIMEIDGRVRQMINDGRTSNEIKKEAEKSGMLNLRRAGIRQATTGVTSIEEIIRVTSSH
jgi:type IV pilus assembly protein PilB